MSKKKKLQPDDYIPQISGIVSEELGIDSDEILKPELRLIDDLHADEDHLAFIVVEIENTLMITIPDCAEEKFTTVKDIYDCVAQVLA
jgi:acyl carrier protein